MRHAMRSLLVLSLLAVPAVLSLCGTAHAALSDTERARLLEIKNKAVENQNNANAIIASSTASEQAKKNAQKSYDNAQVVYDKAEQALHG